MVCVIISALVEQQGNPNGSHWFAKNVDYVLRRRNIKHQVVITDVIKCSNPIYYLEADM